ncbi:MAG: hypothetical protein KBF12_12665 [Sebaldella sp.]|nr:hypothetical protein [Sebaldella sp.]
MKKILLLTLVIMGSTILLAKNPIDKNSCTLNGVKLYGKVKVVKSFPDFKVKRVSSFENLKVETVKSFPSNCGKWQFVDSFPDFTIEYVDSFPDFTIKDVTSFPGVGS